jgi:hypothetical protein
MSKTNSNTNLSSITADDNIKDIHSSRLNESADTSSSSSEDSSLSSDNDELLLQGCIKQAWAAKGKPQFIPKVTIEHFFTYVPSALMPGRTRFWELALKTLLALIWEIASVTHSEKSLQTLAKEIASRNRFEQSLNKLQILFEYLSIWKFSFSSNNGTVVKKTN